MKSTSTAFTNACMQLFQKVSNSTQLTTFLPLIISSSNSSAMPQTKRAAAAAAAASRKKTNHDTTFDESDESVDEKELDTSKEVPPDSEEEKHDAFVFTPQKNKPRPTHWHAGRKVITTKML